ncbi:MAG: DUF4832 domain-containing protein [Nitrospiraceae bacterium]
MRSRTIQGLAASALVMSAVVGCTTVPVPPSVAEGSAARGAFVTVHPKGIDDVLYNPGMGFADFHFGQYSKPAVPDEYPRSTVAYFRWSWTELEPEEGKYAFDFVDGIIAQAKAKGETLAFRILTEYERGTPQWLLAKGVDSFHETDGTFPDYRNPIFKTYHERLLAAFGARYNGSPSIDHVDIGSVGCWGEWNTACCLPEQVPQCQRLYPTEDEQRAIVDAYLRYFPDTPLVMLHNGPLAYATGKGAGWRGDCFGDYGYFTSTWNHMDDAYAPVLKDPTIADAWKRGPVQFEVCGYIQDWYDKGFDLEKILQKGREWHVSVLNAKSHPLPTAWRERLNEYQKQMGYRLVLRELSCPVDLTASDEFRVRSSWENIGVAPIYHTWPLAYRLRNAADAVVLQWTSRADLRQWLPNDRQSIEDGVLVPDSVLPGAYTLDVAVLDQAGQSPYVQLAIEGRRDDGWYAVTSVHVSR